MLEVKNLAKSFGNRQILQNMNFSLKDGGNPNGGWSFRGREDDPSADRGRP